MLRSAEAAKGEVRRRGYDLGEAADDRRWEGPRNKHHFGQNCSSPSFIWDFGIFFLEGHTHLGSIPTSHPPDDRC